MSWNPDQYNKFKSERFMPFYDLLAFIDKKEGSSVIDLGCGTGEITRMLHDALPQSKVLGIDSSEEMLQKSLKSLSACTKGLRCSCRMGFRHCSRPIF